MTCVGFEDPSDGHMDDVHALRDRVGADLVHLIVGRSDNCGAAYVGSAFGITLRRCGGDTFTHELGHNMGLHHDRYQVHHNEGGVSPHPAYGYVNQRSFEPGTPSFWRTIMSYSTQCFEVTGGYRCPQLFRFSNSRQQYNDDPLGVPYGVDGSDPVTGPADAVVVLNATAPALAMWRDRRDFTNRAPTAVGALPDQRLTPRSTLAVDVSRGFVDADGDALTYVASSSATQIVTVSTAGAQVTLTASSRVGTATIQVMATDAEGLSATQRFGVTVTRTVTFTDHPIRAGETPIRAVHFAELRTRIDGLRRAVGLAQFRWTDEVLTPGVTPVQLVHLRELRAALAATYAAAKRPAPRWSDPALVAGSTQIRAVHLMELRAAVTALE